MGSRRAWFVLVGNDGIDGATLISLPNALLEARLEEFEVAPLVATSGSTSLRLRSNVGEDIVIGA